MRVRIYEYDLDVTGMTDDGVSLDAILSGKEKIPPQGVRVDVAFEGRATGRLAGRVRGHRLSPDAGRRPRRSRNSRGRRNGERLPDCAVRRRRGVPRVAEPIADLLENVRLSTAAGEYLWVNTRQVWGVGTVNFAAGKIHIDAYMQ